MSHSLLTLSSLQIILNVFCVSCITIPCSPMYDLHFDLHTRWWEDTMITTSNQGQYSHGHAHRWPFWYQQLTNMYKMYLLMNSHENQPWVLSDWVCLYWMRNWSKVITSMYIGVHDYSVKYCYCCMYSRIYWQHWNLTLNNLINNTQYTVYQ